MAKRTEDFSIEQNIRKKDYIAKHGHVVIEKIVGDIIVKDPTNIAVEFRDGTKKGIKELVALNEQVTELRKSGFKDMLLGLLGVK